MTIYKELEGRIEKGRVYTKRELVSLISSNENDGYIILHDLIANSELILTKHYSGNTGYRLA